MDNVFFKGKVVKEEEARVPLATHTLQYGTGVFDSVRGYWSRKEKCLYLLKPQEHFARLLNSARIMGWHMKETKEGMTKDLISLVHANAPQEDIYVRPFIFQSSTKLAPLLNDDFEPTFAMYMIGLGDYLATDKGLKGKVTSWRRVEDSAMPPRAKICGLYVNSSLARAEAAAAGADEAIFLNEDGSVCEGSGENIFIVRDGTLVTPPVSANILEGVTRACVIALAKEEGIAVLERTVNRSELYIADEVFLTGTACQVAYFSEIDGRTIGNGQCGKMTAQLQKRYFDAVHGKNDLYAHWLVKT